MFKVACVYFLLYFQKTMSEHLSPQDNYTTVLRPLLDIISVQGRIAESIPEE